MLCDVAGHGADRGAVEAGRGYGVHGGSSAGAESAGSAGCGRECHSHKACPGSRPQGELLPQRPAGRAAGQGKYSRHTAQVGPSEDFVCLWLVRDE